MGLAREVSVAGLAERGSRASRRLGQELIQARPRHQEQAVCGPGAGDGEPTERGVELVELRRAGQRVEGDGDAVRLTLPAVDRRGDEVVLGKSVLLFSRSTASVASSTAWFRVARIATSGSPIRRRLDDGDVAGGRAGGVVLGLVQRETAGEQFVEEGFDELRQRQVDVGRLGFLEPIDLQQRRNALADLLPDLCRQSVESFESDGPVAGCSDAVELFPLGIERPPQRQLARSRPPDRRELALHVRASLS